MIQQTEFDTLSVIPFFSMSVWLFAHLHLQSLEFEFSGL